MAEQFQVDTSGVVSWVVSHPEPGQRYAMTWSDLSPFTQGYVEAALSDRATDVSKADWLTDAERGRPADPGAAALPCDVGFSDLAPETLGRIIDDSKTIRAAFPGNGNDSFAGGRAIWASRQSGVLRPILQPLTPYLGDDGKVYLREGA